MIITNQQKSRVLGRYVVYESEGDKDSKLSIDQYFDIITHYLKDLIDYHKSKGEWKTQKKHQCESFLFLSQMQIKLMKCTQKVIT